jgi:hypothetical protein
VEPRSTFAGGKFQPLLCGNTRVHTVAAADFSVVWISCSVCDWSITAYRDGRPPERAAAPLPGFAPDPWPRRPAPSPGASDVAWEWDTCSQCGAEKARRFEACDNCGHRIARP